MRTRVVMAAVVMFGFLMGSHSLAQATESTSSFYFGAPTRTVIDTAPAGNSVGDLTITTGDIQRTSRSKAIGFYTTNQVTVRADTASGREIRKVDLSLSLPDGMIFGTSLIRAKTGVPPTAQMTFAVTGGTGAYKGARGEIVHEGVAGKPGFSVTLKLE